jgi:DNA-binding CsgD family transcriptional regulator
MEYGAPPSGQSTQVRNHKLEQDDSGGHAGSSADLFPKLVSMQRTCGSEAFAMLVVQAHTLLTPGRIECKMHSPGSEAMVAKLTEEQSAFLLSHLYSSPRPLIFAPEGYRTTEMSPAKTVHVVDKVGLDLAFPVQLGAMGNGYVVFFAVHTAINNELLIDLHRKSLTIMREKLRVVFGSTSETEKMNEREIECLQLVGNGMKSEAIGERLNLSVHTVNAYLGSATTKLNAVNRIQAIAKAIRLGLVA